MGRLVERTGDLFTTDAKAIGHGCNIRGAMASGIALQFKRRFPGMEAEYRAECDRAMWGLGDVKWWCDIDSGLMIANLMTQVNPGHDGRYLGIMDAVRSALICCQEQGVDRLAVPRIGCGIAGLTWDGGVRELLQELAWESPVDIEAWRRTSRS